MNTPITFCLNFVANGVPYNYALVRMHKRGKR